MLLGSARLAVMISANGDRLLAEELKFGVCNRVHGSDKAGASGSA